MSNAAILADIERDETIAELRAEVSRLREIAFGTDTVLQGRMATRLDLTPAESWVLATLYALQGDVLTIRRMVAGMPGRLDEDERVSNNCAVIVCRLRKKMGSPDHIRTMVRIGYSLTAEGIDWLTTQLSVDTVHRFEQKLGN